RSLHVRAPLSFPTRRSSDLRRTSMPKRKTAEVESPPAPAPAAPSIAASRIDHIELARLVRAPENVRQADPTDGVFELRDDIAGQDRKSTRLNSSHVKISYAV